MPSNDPMMGMKKPYNLSRAPAPMNAGGVSVRAPYDWAYARNSDGSPKYEFSAAGDLGNVIEATSTGGRRSDFLQRNN
jgi:hypothetical protein